MLLMTMMLAKIMILMIVIILMKTWTWNKDTKEARLYSDEDWKQLNE